MHKDAHNFQLPAGSCLVDDEAATALGRFLTAAIEALSLKVRFTRSSASHTAETQASPAIHRLTFVFDGEQEGAAKPVIALAARAVALSATMPAQAFIDRMKANIIAAKTTARSTVTAAVFNLDPDPVVFMGVDLSAGPDRTASVSVSIDHDGRRRVIEDPTAPGADPTIDENETNL